jgi:hypothetical protein
VDYHRLARLVHSLGPLAVLDAAEAALLIAAGRAEALEVTRFSGPESRTADPAIRRNILPWHHP